MTYDLHIHSCLSPCADDDMTPATIAGFAKLAGIDLIAIADHNAADNLPAAAVACAAYGVKLLPAIEVNTAEDIHILTYFDTVEAALQMGEKIYDALPDYPVDSRIWGRQLVMDEHDEVVGSPQKLLTAACRLTLGEIKQECEWLGGIAVPAHVDKEAFSLLAVLGFVPEELNFAAFELRWPEKNLAALQQSSRLPLDAQILTSSDAHTRADLPDAGRPLAQNSVLRSLL